MPAPAPSAWGPGINLGNTLDAPTEGSWAPAATERDFDAYLEAGFKSVRIPVRWDQHMGNSEPYAVDSSYMDRVEEVVDWALERNFTAIINSHHDDWLDQEDDGAFAEQLPRFEALWRQVADRFKDKDDAALAFEIYNEPHVMSAESLNAMNAAVLPIIRESNPTRTTILGGLGWMGIWWLQQHPDSMIVDFNTTAGVRDENLWLEVHDYDPYDYTSSGPTIASWGSDDDKAAVAETFDFLTQWSADHNDMQIILGEFGCTHDQSAATGRIEWYQTYVKEARAHDLVPMVWDDDGWYQVYDRAADSWDEDVLDALVN